MSEFYTGYAPKAPPGVARFLRRVTAGLLCVAAALALLLAGSQQPFAESRFEYGQYRDFEGWIDEDPYPSLRNAGGRLWLVAPGKWGAAGWVQGYRSRGVRLKGELIQRGTDRMLQLQPGSVRAHAAPPPVGVWTPLGAITLTGEIVDSKCYLGVMNPGSGKVHRDCAVRCLSGGIPPALIAADSTGRLRTVILAGAAGRPLHRELLPLVAERVRISGTLRRSGETLLLEAHPNSLHRVPAGGWE